MSPTSPEASHRITFLHWYRAAGPWILGAASTGIVGLMLFALAGKFHAKVPGIEDSSRSGPRHTGETVTVRSIRRPRWETAVGTIKPVRESTIASKLLARVVEIGVRAGQTVEADEVLLRLDDADLRARLRQAEATERTAVALQEQAATELDRARRLVATKAISQSELDRAAAIAKTTQAEVERARQSIQEANVLLEFAVIHAPFAGLVVDKRVEQGDMVLPGQVLLTLYDPSHMQMVANVRESLALKLAVGQQLPARIDSLDFDCQAAISEIVPESQVASRSFQVKVTGPCPPGVHSGMFGRLMLPVGEEDILVIPADGLRRVGQLTLVDVVVGDRVWRRSVQVGREIDADVEVLSGLREGEEIQLAKSVSPETPG